MDFNHAVAAGPAAGRMDPANCKGCPSWNDATGRCRIPAAERCCGWSEAVEPAGPQPAFSLFGGQS